MSVLDTSPEAVAAPALAPTATRRRKLSKRLGLPLLALLWLASWAVFLGPITIVAHLL